jgi:hypothetical protein
MSHLFNVTNGSLGSKPGMGMECNGRSDIGGNCTASAPVWSGGALDPLTRVCAVGIGL